jgi:alpha,alpha-trehalase
VMVAWNADTAVGLLALLPEWRRETLRRRIGLTDDEVETWTRMSSRMFVPFHGDGIISQFEGYEDLAELDWAAYRERYGNIQRLDRILKAAGDEPDRYKATKQADTVLLFFLFPEEELRRIFERLGYPFTPDTVPKNLAYYDGRTSHGSTLSFVAHAGAFSSVDLAASWDRYLVALESDIGDVQRGTTAEGIHMGVMSGTLDLVQRFYLGQEVRDGVLCFRPKPMPQLDGLSLALRFQGRLVEVTLDGGQVRVTARPDGLHQPIKVAVGEAVREIRAGESHVFEL